MKQKSFRLLRNLSFIFTLLNISVSAQIGAPKILNDVRSFEVTACAPFNNNIVAAWMEKRPERKDNSEDAADMRIAYKSSVDNGRTWNEKGIIDMPDTFGNGNPFVTSSRKGAVYLVCMHIGTDFYSGNISLYEFNFKLKKFVLKSVPIKSTDHLLDKPAIVCNGKEIHLVYISYPKRDKNSVKYLYSKDDGLTWSEPMDVFTNGTGSYLGPSITVLDNKQVAVSVGSYGFNKEIYFVKKKMDTDKAVFETPVSVAKITREQGAAMSELYSDGSRLVLSWQNPHQRSEIWMAVSRDSGSSWNSPQQIIKFGNLFSGVFDTKGNLHCIYSDFADDRFSVSYKQFDEKNNLIKHGYVKESAPLPAFNEYLGAFQKLLITNYELNAFWIDYPDDHTLKLTNWKIN
ncbi:sialidase family protein [Flavobacterium notoginsengisoli]|uniref:sialidase family protein n=1 Tax=Flavobacterium notoginsengisoli TaxID=1478199 RepID=UPI003638A70D